MADLTHLTQNRLHKEACAGRKKVLMLGGPLAIATCFIVPALSWLALATLAIVWKKAVDRVKMAGAEGEERALETLKRLPDNYTIFRQVEIPDCYSRTGHTEADFIVVSRNGIMVMEVKNNSGVISGHSNDPAWTSKKFSRKGTAYAKEICNPIKQVNRQVYALRNYLAEQGINQWIDSVVYFTNPECQLNIDNDSAVPIYNTSVVGLSLMSKNADMRLGTQKAVIKALKQLTEQ